MATSDGQLLHWKCCPHHQQNFMQALCASDWNGANKTDLCQLSPTRESSSYRVMVSSDSSSCNASSCALHVHFQAVCSLASSVYANFAFAAGLLPIEWTISTEQKSHQARPHLQSAFASSSNTSTCECQCLHQEQTTQALSKTLSACSCSSLADRRCPSPLSSFSSSAQLSPESCTLAARNFSTSVCKQVTDDTLCRTPSDRHQARRPNTMSCPRVFSVKPLLFWSWTKSIHQLLMLTLLTLALCSLPTLCDTQLLTSMSLYPSASLHHRYPRITPEEFPNGRLNRTLTLQQVSQMNRQVRQPQIHHYQFCGDPPLVSNANSNLQRNQKHYVFPVGITATYMCDQGYKPVNGNAETRCSYLDQINAQASAPTSHVLFPDMAKSDSDSDHHVVLLNSGRSKNSKRLMSDLDEEPDANANGHKVVFPGNYADKRKMSRKTDDDLIGSVYDATSTTNLDARNSDLENDSVEYLEKRKQRMDMIPRWWPPISLNCQKVNCTDPGQVEHARRTDSSNGQFYFNSNVLYQCEEGYQTIGIPILTCKANGSWNRPTPKCLLKQCPILPPLNGGRILYTNERRTDSRAEYHCDGGFRLNAISPIRHCRQDDKWSPLEPVNFASGLPNATDPYQCVPVECSPPVRPHAGLRILNLGRKRKFIPGDVIIYSCESVKTKATAKCRPDGEWSREPPHCPELNPRCPQLPHFPHGDMTVEQSKANFSCFDGYELDGVSSITCTNKGIWNAPVPRCVLNLPAPKVIHPTNQSNLNGNLHAHNAKGDGEIATLEQQQQITSNRLVVLLIVIGILASVVIAIAAVVLYKMRNDKLQRQRWRNYFGHYHHRQSKTNIVVSSTYNNLNGSGGMPSGLSSLNNSIGMAASRHLLQRRNEKNSSVPHTNFLQSSFSSSDDNPVDGKSFNTGTISSEHARTVSTYADDTCPEDEYDEEDEEEDMYSNSSMLQKKTASLAQPVPATRRLNNSTPSVLTMPESTPMMLLSPSSVPNTRSQNGLTDPIYSNLPHPGISSGLSAAPGILSPAVPKSNVPVTEL